MSFYCEKDKTDEKILERFIDLGWVAIEFILRKLDCPWKVCWCAIDFCVDEVSNPAKSKGKGCRNGERIHKRERRHLSFFCEIVTYHSSSDQAAMKGETTVPECEDFQRVSKVVGRVVEDDFSESCADDNSNDQ